MRQTIRLRALPAAPHPPYGLFPDPHRGTHAWFAVDSRSLLALVTLVGVLGTLLNVAVR